MKDAKQKNTGKLSQLLSLAAVFFKIGLFTFGGGYAMIPIIQSEVAEKRKWISEEELMNIVTIAESTPGPIAINCATYVGYKICGFFGSLAATVSVVLAPFTIIYLISLFLRDFLEISFVANAFKGIQIAVAFLILSAGIKFVKKLKKEPFPIIAVTLTVAVMLILDIFALSFSSVYLVIMGAFAGFMMTLIQLSCKKKSEKNEEKEDKNV